MEPMNFPSRDELASRYNTPNRQQNKRVDQLTTRVMECLNLSDTYRGSIYKMCSRNSESYVVAAMKRAVVFDHARHRYRHFASELRDVRLSNR